jgi:hypothetical protein
MPPSRCFLAEPIEAEFSGQPLLLKKTGCPAAFRWRGERFEVTDVLREWHAYGRRGRMADNMSPAHAAAAMRRGSYGVGRDYYTVRTAGGRVFTIYYDRAVKDASNALGEWILLEEGTDEPAGGKDTSD